MRRRTFIALLGGAAAAWPMAARAQQARMVGMLMQGTGSEPAVKANITAFQDGMRALGWVEGRNLRLEVRWNGGEAERARAAAAELVGLAPDVLLSATTANLLALQRATRSIPIVFLLVSDPVAQGFVTSVARPGGNITGFSAYEFSIGGKWLELLKQIAPALTRVGIMFNPDTSPQSKFFTSAVTSAGPNFGVEVIVVPVHQSADIQSGIESLSRDGKGGLILPTDTFTRLRQKSIAEMTAKYRVPSISAAPEFIDAGGLMFYGPSMVEQLSDQFRQAASYIDRILKGAKPGDLPIQGATKFSLYINRKTAAALGLDIPSRLLFTADRVIE